MKQKDIGMNVMKHVRHVMLMVQKIDKDASNVNLITIYKIIYLITKKIIIIIV